MPIRQGHIRAIRVVRGQDAADQREEVREPACLQRCPYGGATIPFADLLVADMGMRYCFVRSCWMGIDGHHKVRHLVIQIPQSFYVQGNAKPPQVDFFQGNRFGDGT